VRRAATPRAAPPRAERRRVAPPLAFAAAALALASAGSGRLAAAELAGAPSYIPASYGPGDEVAATAAIAPSAGEALSELELLPGAGLPPQGGSVDPELRGIEIARSSAGWRMKVRFVPWSPGRGLVPGVVAGGVAFPPLPYDAASRLGPEDRDPAPPRPQRLPPGAALALYALVGALLLLALAAFGFVAYLLPASRALLAKWRAGQAFRRLGKSLDYLAAHAASAEPAAYSAALARALRLYLAARVAPLAPSLTPAELAALPDDSFPAPATRERAASLLAWSDEVRFGGAAALAATLGDAAEKARRIAAENEEALIARA
jgi:hypothetical protein